MKNTLNIDFSEHRSPPSNKKRKIFLGQIKSIVEMKKASLRFEKVKKDEIAPPWLAGHHVMDCHVELNEFVSTFRKGEKQFGSAVSSDLEKVFVHSLSEGLERFFQDSWGAKHSRPSINSAYSCSSSNWVSLKNNPLSINENRLHSTSGEAFHIDRSESMRAAFCEMIERYSIVRLERGSANVQNITDWCRENHVLFRSIERFIPRLGFRIEVLKISIKVDLPTIIVYLINKKGLYPHCFRGSSCDGDIVNAVDQALSEATRSAFFGAALKYERISQAKKRLASCNFRDYDFGLLKRMIDSKTIEEISSEAPKVAKEKVFRGFSINSCYKKIISENDLLLIPLFTPVRGLEGWAYKFFSDTIPQYQHICEV